jgi:hypothetical protein
VNRDGAKYGQDREQGVVERVRGQGDAPEPGVAWEHCGAVVGEAV